MLGERIKQYRLSKGMSLDELVASTGGIISKVALSKYERNIIKPSNKVINSISKALDVKIVDLINPSAIQVDFVAYRKGSGLAKKEQLNVENLAATTLEQRIKIQNLFFNNSKSILPVKFYKINSLEDTETASMELRKLWNLGLDAIANLTYTLENNFVHVICFESSKYFDGISAIASQNNDIKAAAVISKSGISGERQRLNLAHELGHLVLDIAPGVDEEKAAFRFAGAFLAPKPTVIKIVGSRREHFQLHELLMLKKTFGMSIQSLLFRLKDLEIINNSMFSTWFRIINKNKWKKDEPLSMKEEKSSWYSGNVLRAFSEGLIGSEEAGKLLGESAGLHNLNLIRKKEFMKLTLKDRNDILASDAEELLTYYNNNSDLQNLGEGDFADY